MLEIRSINFQDIQSLVKIHEACFTQPYDPPWSAQQLHSTLCQNGIKAFCVVSDTEPNLIRGFGVFQLQPDFFEVLTLAVSPVFQRQGVAKFLLTQVFQREEVSSIPCFLEVGSLNYKAVNLYKQFGFIEVGRRKNYYRVFGVSQTDEALVLKRE